MEVLSGGEAALRIPSGFSAVSMAPSEAKLDRSKAESDAMLGKTIIVRCKGYGWCVGKIIKKVTRGLANFIAKFEVDDEPSVLTLESSDYDISPDAEYNAWMIIEPEDEVAEADDGEAATVAMEADAA